MLSTRVISKAIIALLCIVAISCHNLSKRYKTRKLTWPPQSEAKNYIDVEPQTYIVKEVKEKEQTPTILSLSPKAQAQLIEAISAKTSATTPDGLFKYLPKKITIEQSKEKVKIFPSTITKSIVFSVDRFSAAPGASNNGVRINRIADRIQYLEIELKGNALGSVIFDSWNKFVSEYATVDLGKVSSSQGWTAAVSVSANYSGKNNSGISNSVTDVNANKVGDNSLSNTGVSGSSNGKESSFSYGPSASINYSDKYETSQDLKMDRLKLGTKFRPDGFVLKQEGAFGVDLSGNTAVSVNYTFQGAYAAPVIVHSFSEFYKVGEALPFDSLKLNKTVWIFPNFTTELQASVKYRYIIRHVRHYSQRHIPEARQNVEFIYGQVGYTDDAELIKMPLIKVEDLCPSVYIVKCDGTAIKWNTEDLKFETIEEAAKFIAYLVQKAGAVVPVKTLSFSPTISSKYTIEKIQLKGS